MEFSLSPLVRRARAPRTLCALEETAPHSPLVIASVRVLEAAAIGVGCNGAGEGAAHAIAKGHRCSGRQAMANGLRVEAGRRRLQRQNEQRQQTLRRMRTCSHAGTG